MGDYGVRVGVKPIMGTAGARRVSGDCICI